MQESLLPECTGPRWKVGNPERVALALVAIVDNLRAAAQATPGDAQAWQLLSLTVRHADDTRREVDSPELDEGHITGFALDLHALVTACMHMPDAAPEAGDYLRAVLARSPELFQALGVTPGH